MDNTFKTALASYIKALQEKIDAHTEKHFPDAIDLLKTTLSVDPRGKKYLRIVKSMPGGSRSVHSFVEVATGDIWKAASWKAPAKNFPRGNIYNDDPTEGTNVYSANYAY